MDILPANDYLPASLPLSDQRRYILNLNLTRLARYGFMHQSIADQVRLLSPEGTISATWIGKLPGDSNSRSSLMAYRTSTDYHLPCLTTGRPPYSEEEAEKYFDHSSWHLAQTLLGFLPIAIMDYDYDADEFGIDRAVYRAEVEHIWEDAPSPLFEISGVNGMYPVPFLENTCLLPLSSWDLYEDIKALTAGEVGYNENDRVIPLYEYFSRIFDDYYSYRQNTIGYEQEGNNFAVKLGEFAQWGGIRFNDPNVLESLTSMDLCILMSTYYLLNKDFSATLQTLPQYQGIISQVPEFPILDWMAIFDKKTYNLGGVFPI